MTLAELLLAVICISFITLLLFFIAGIRLDIGDGDHGFHLHRTKIRYVLTYSIPWIFLTMSRYFAGVVSWGKMPIDRKKKVFFKIEVLTTWDFIHRYNICLGRYFLSVDDYKLKNPGNN